MQQKKIRTIQLVVGLVVSFVFALIEYYISTNSFWLMLVFFAVSYSIGSLFEGYFKQKLFKAAVEEFISSLKQIRIDFFLKPVVVQAIMKQVTNGLVELTGSNLKATQKEISLAGKHFCKTCEDPEPHLTDSYGRCTHCNIGLKFWQKMEGKN